MASSFPLLNMSYEQISLLTAQLLVYQQYLQRKVASSAKRERTLRVLLALLRRLHALFESTHAPQMLLLTDEEVAVIKEALTVLQRGIEAKPPSAQRALEIQRLVAMRTLIERTFPETC